MIVVAPDQYLTVEVDGVPHSGLPDAVARRAGFPVDSRPSGAALLAALIREGRARVVTYGPPLAVLI